MSELDRCRSLAATYADSETIVGDIPGRIVGYAYADDAAAYVLVEAHDPAENTRTLCDPVVPGLPALTTVLTTERRVAGFFYVDGDVVRADYEDARETFRVTCAKCENVFAVGWKMTGPWTCTTCTMREIRANDAAVAAMQHPSEIVSAQLAMIRRSREEYEARRAQCSESVAKMLDDAAETGRRYMTVASTAPVWHPSHAPSPYLGKCIVACANCHMTTDGDITAPCNGTPGAYRAACEYGQRNAMDAIDEIASEVREEAPRPPATRYRSPVGFGTGHLMGGAFWGYGWTVRR